MDDPQSCVALVDWLRTGLTLVLAIAASAAAGASWRSSHQAKAGVEATKQGVKATTMMAMIDAYSTQRMHKDLKLLATDEKWWTKEKKNVPSRDEFDAARRNVHFYYKKAYQLCAAGLIDDEFMREWVADTNGYALFFSSVLPASKHIELGQDKASQDMSRYAWADDLKDKFPPRK